MSEEQQTPGGADEHSSEAPAETQRSASRRVSRETPEETPEQKMLNEIMDRGMPPDPGPDVSRETEDGASGETAVPPDGPADVSRETEKSPQSRRASAYLYLLILFGAAFLMLLLAYFVQQRNNEAVRDDLRSTTASRGELVEENQKLTEENEELEVRLAVMEDQRDRAYTQIDELDKQLYESQTLYGEERIKARAVSCLWYLSRFMEARDYPMAAAAMYFSADSYTGNLYKENPALLEQFHGYQQELIDRGYLELVPHPEEASPTDSSIPTSLAFTEQWDPSQNDDMAAMSILWCALEGHFLNKDDNAASQFLFLTPLGDPATGYPGRVEQLASSFTLEQFQIMRDELAEGWWITVLADGSIIENYSASHPDVRYNLPFQLPETWSWKYS